MEKHKCIGLMSGTSLDGLDIVLADFWQENELWKYRILNSETYYYNSDLKKKLQNSHNLNALDFSILDLEYGRYIGDKINEFSRGHDNILFAASHGHTVFHQPEKGISIQIGNGNAIRSKITFPLINDFRSADVLMGGQGAPLVPIGDKLLFTEFGACINLGGFANLSFEKNDKRIAFDICPANFVLNHYCKKINLEYDKGGELAASGEINLKLLNELNKLDFYKLSHPKSLGREWLESKFFPICENYEIEIKDMLATLVEHSAIQIANSLKNNKGKILITGGGAYNSFLINRISENINNNIEIVLPEKTIIDFKEALIFAFMGLLRYQGKVNVLSSVTGASYNHSAGTIYS